MPSPAPAPKLDNHILLLHPPSVDPNGFLTRLIGHSTSAQEPATWNIDNKYYSAQVTFDPVPLGRATDDDFLRRYGAVEVVLYLFEGAPPHSLHPTLVKLLASPRDIALSVRVHSSTASSAADQAEIKIESEDDGANDEILGGAGAEVDPEELFGEIGMEFVDEVNPLTEEDDERPLEPLELIRQTLMTHLWPNMVRKPSVGPSQFPSSGPSSPLSSSGSVTSPKAAFPITFNQRAPGSDQDPSLCQGSNSPFPAFALPVASGSQPGFPGLDELRAAIQSGEFDALDKLDRLNDDFGFGFDDDDDGDGYDDFGPGAEEYARLDDWLDEDDDEFEPRELLTHGQGENDGQAQDRGEGEGAAADEIRAKGSGPDNDEQHEGGSVNGDGLEAGSGGEHDVDDQPFVDHEREVDISNGHVRNGQGIRAEGNIIPDPSGDLGGAPTAEGFEDDFEDDFDFASFHSAPAPLVSSGSGAPRDTPTSLDPTPLLLHLQTVRAELAGVVDEDERRVRAGREVAQVLASLGMGGDDLGLLDDETW